MLKRWSDGWVEPIEPPEHPRHIAAQQLMALCLQEHRITASAPSSGFFGELDPALLGAALPVTGCAGDQEAAAFGQGIDERVRGPGEVTL